MFLPGLDKLLHGLEFGLPSVALPLTDISLRLTRGQYLALFASGCATADESKNLTQETFAECIGADGASLLRAKSGTNERASGVACATFCHGTLQNRLMSSS